MWQFILGLFLGANFSLILYAISDWVSYLNRLGFDMLYSKDNVEYISKENLNKIKEIMYIIGLLVKNNYEVITRKNFTREKLIKIYNDCKEKQLDYEGTDYAIDNFIRYFYRSVVNELTRNKDPSFFMPKKEENLEEGEEI